jgi:hypothetical protein
MVQGKVFKSTSLNGHKICACRGVSKRRGGDLTHPDIAALVTPLCFAKRG